MAVKNEELVFKKIIEEKYRLCKHKDYVFPREIEEKLINNFQNITGTDMTDAGFRKLFKQRITTFYES